MKTLIYDIETYPNVFTCYFSDNSVFEISWRKNQIRELIQFLYNVDEMVGFNNVMFDYPVLHFIIENQHCITSELIFEKANQIINTPYTDRFKNVIWSNHQHVVQIDLFSIHHFDNPSKSTSLKALQFAMKSESVQDLPFKAGQYLTITEIEKLIEYNKHDVDETFKFWKISKEQIEFRRQICKETGLDAMNYNDTKIGKKYFEQQLEKFNPGCCSKYEGIMDYCDCFSPKKKRQTLRKPPFDLSNLDSCPKEFQLSVEPIDEKLPNTNDFKTEKQYIKAIDKHEKKCIKNYKKWQKDCQKKQEQNKEAVWIPVKNILFDYIKFQTPAFNDLLSFYKNLNITHTKSSISTICEFKEFEFHLGAGGIHGSIESSIIKSDNNYVIRDIDVKSYYPNLAIKNNLYPAHLGKLFCKIYKKLFDKRETYKKGTIENLMLKLALNGVYGDSNNKYSVFYDPQYTMTITINGQLLLCMLAEQLMHDDSLELIQINTDGLTIKYHKASTTWVERIEQWWMDVTKLNLESNNYKTMYIRDVNNYIAEYENGELKKKGVYEYNRNWHQDQSGMVIQKAVEAYLIKGINVEHFIKSHKNKFDFMMRAKVKRNDRLVLFTDGTESEQQKIIRFYFSKNGGELFKYMSPLKTKPNQIRRNAYQGSKGWKVKICNHINDFEGDIDYDYYIKETYKLIKPMEN